MTRLSIDSNDAPFIRAEFPRARAAREHKGRSLLATPEDYTVFDLETTGLDPTQDAIIEIGAIRYRGGVEVARFSSLVNPDCQIDDFITSLTGITNAMLADQPPISYVLPRFLSFAGEDIMVGHNVNFDVNFVYDACARLGAPFFCNDFIDTLRLARLVFPTCPNYKLGTVSAYLGLPQSSAHRSLADVETTNACYATICKYLSDNSITLERNQYHNAYHPSRDIVRTTDEYIDADNPLYGKKCVFTGELERLNRQEAMQIVTNIGGMCADSVSKKVSYVIVGSYNYDHFINYGKSTKHKRAEQLMLEGHDIQVISESVFYDMIQDYVDSIANLKE